MGIKVVSLKCSVCGGVLDNYRGQKQVKCAYCGNVELIEPGLQQATPAANPRFGLIIAIAVVLFLGGGSAAYFLQSSQSTTTVKDSISNPKAVLAKDTANKGTNGDPLGH